MRAFVQKLASDSSGAVMVEFAIILTLTLLLTGGVAEGLFALFQFNSVVKAAERGARLAVVTSPVALDMPSLNTTAGTPGSDYPAGGYSYSCTASGTTYAGLNVSCMNTVGNATAAGGADKNAFATIFFGRPVANVYSCGSAAGTYYVGMCGIASGLTPSNVTVRYDATGLGFYGAPQGPTPTVTIQVSGVPYNFFFISALAKVVGANMPTIRVTATSEDLSTTYTP